jgi:hypothetical protein
LEPEVQKKIVSDFVDKSILEKGVSGKAIPQSKIDLWKVSSGEVETLKEKTGLNLDGYTHKLENYGLQYALNGHSNTKIEERRGLIPITKDDLKNIPDVLKNYDNVEYSGKNQVGRDVIIYSKKVNGYIIYVEEIRAKNKELIPQTMYKKKSGNETMPKADLIQVSTPEATLPQGKIIQSGIENQENNIYSTEKTQKPAVLKTEIPIEKTSGIIVNRNYAKDRIEVTFNKTPSDEIINKLRANGFYWSEKEQKWIARHTEKRFNFANALAGEGKTGDTQGLRENIAEENKKSNKKRIPGRDNRKNNLE